MCCSNTCAKILLFIFNIFFFLAGLLALALGIFLLVDKTSLLSLLTRIPSVGEAVEEVISQTSFLENAAYMLIAAGAFVLIVGFTGCCGALRESRCLLLTYAIIVGIIVVLEVAAGVLCYLYAAEVQAYFSAFLLSLIVDKYNGATITSSGLSLGSDTTGISNAIDFAQVYFSCCGVSNYTDYQLTTSWNNTYSGTVDGTTYNLVAVVPVSCCAMTSSSGWPYDLSSVTFTDLNGCITASNVTAINTDGCVDTVKAKFLQYSDMLMYVGIVVGGVQLLGILCAACMYSKVGRDKVNTV